MEAAEAHKRVLELCSMVGEKFIDRDDFPPNNKSVYLNGVSWRANSDNAHRSSRLGQLTWLRPADITFPDTRLASYASAPIDSLAGFFGAVTGMRVVGGGFGPSTSMGSSRGRVVVIDDAPAADDIRQQALGDCWLISALALVAERPDLLRLLLPIRTVNDVGAYQVRLCHDGEWRILLIDDFLPCIQPSSPVGPAIGMPGFPAFAYAARRQLWVPLVEKAMAKLYGCYEALEGGTTDEALATLTGFPCERISLSEARRGGRAGAASAGDMGKAGNAAQSELSDPELLWARLLSFHEAGFLIAASVGTSDAGEAAAAEAMGLLTEHAYSLLRVVSPPADVAGRPPPRLCKLRNPWGKLEWRGDWSAQSVRWTPALRAVLDYSNATDDGTFWMSFEDVLDYFRHIEVCRVRPDWPEVRVRGQIPALQDWANGHGGSSSDGMGAFELEILETCDVEATLIQKNGRGDPTHDLTDLLLVIISRDAGAGSVGGWRLIASSSRELKISVTLEATLSPGKYLVLPLSLRPRSGVQAQPLPYVLRLGSAKPLLCEAIAATAHDVRSGLACYCRAKGERHAAFEGMATYSLHDRAGWITYAENTSSMRFTVSLDHEGSFNVLPSRGSLSTYDVLPPSRGQVLQVLSLGSHDDGCRMQSRIQYRADMLSAETHSPDSGSFHVPLPLLRAGGSEGGGIARAQLADLLDRFGMRFL